MQGRPVKVQCEPEITSEQLHRKELRERYRERCEEHQRKYVSERRQNSDEWISSSGGNRKGYQINESCGSTVENDGKRIEMRLVKV